MAEEKSLKEILDEIIADGKLTREEMKRFDDAVLADGKLTHEERQYIHKLMEMVRRGELEVVD